MYLDRETPSYDPQLSAYCMWVFGAEPGAVIANGALETPYVPTVHGRSERGFIQATDYLSLVELDTVLRHTANDNWRMRAVR